MQAHNVREVEREHEMYLQAWLNARVQDTKEKGTGKNSKQVPVYKSFKDFYDYEERRNEVLNYKKDLDISPNMKKAVQMAKEINS